ncbi:hypothetical protein ABD76_12455 [Paenibacillus dendritiformis]|uniref:twin-arginine translocase TatA/TatE family subunit n=1 Tax=Paenibacillus dendritiformis TaxID=130049 RepID=UPI0018CE79A6|nr:twin-arginine translocase TatA/TatE family subunit [Paenibacillus dendritiformis]MBG9793257.1 hypothetical protein [Paenibacillus dendritiformis]
MGIGNIGAGGIVLLVILALLLFGPSKLPELGRAFGRTLSEFKQATRSLLTPPEKDAEPDQEQIRNPHS